MGIYHSRLGNDMTGRCKDSRKVGNNTYKVRLDDGSIAIKLHQTNVVTVAEDDTITLNSGGWHTLTTKDRINAWLPSPWVLSQDKGTWYVSKGWLHYDGTTKDALNEGHAFIYADHMSIHPDGCVTGYIPYNADYDKQLKELKKRVKEYAALYVRELPLPAPNNGDCWYCSFHEVDTGRAMGDLRQLDMSPKDILRALNHRPKYEAVDMAPDHLIAHMLEPYVVPSLAYNALKEFGASQYTWWTAFSKEFHEARTADDWSKKDIQKYVYKYVLRRFGLAV